MNCAKCAHPVMMSQLRVVGGANYHAECVPPSPPDPLVAVAIGLLEKGIEALKRNNRYNKTLDYSDYLTSGLQTSVDRVVEPLLRLHSSPTYDSAVDCPTYTALHCAWVLAGCPPSKISTASKLNPHIQSKSYECASKTATGDSPPMIPTLTMPQHDLSSKLTGDVE